MDRKTVTAGLKAFRNIDASIARKLTFAEETGEKDYQYEAERLGAVKHEIMRCLNALPERETEYIWQHYVKGASWAWICQSTRYSERQLRNVSTRGLDALAVSFDAHPTVSEFCKKAVSNYYSSSKIPT